LNRIKEDKDCWFCW